MIKSRLLGAVLGLAVSAGAASAADLYRAAPAPAPVAPVLIPSYVWTGAYVGVQAGYGWGDVSRWRSSDPDGFLAGVHGGFNYQFNMLVVGVDASWSWSDMSSRWVDINWSGDVRGRVGVAIDRVHLFAAGGVAFADTDIKFRKGGKTETGWTAGLGAEYAVTNNWVLGAQWKYADYGRVSSGGGGRHADLTTNVFEIRASYKF